jgi:hypothetical protein
LKNVLQYALCVKEMHFIHREVSGVD